MELRGLTIPYAKNKAKNVRKKEMDVQKQLEELESLVSSDANTTRINQAKMEYTALKEELRLIYENKGKSSIIRSKTRWIEHGEKPTKHFFNLEKRNYNRKVIKSLKQSDEQTILDEAKILEEIEAYYKYLYTSPLDTAGSDLFDDFITNLDITKLENEVRDELEGEITVNECQDILRTFKRGKLPGDDGFTWEFYNCFFDILGQDLVDSFNASYNAGEMSISQRRGVITLIPKQDSDLSSLNNWRPITLLNLDYKVAFKVIAKRIEKVLSLLVSPDQTGFIKGRYIG